jgi:hypothetical protein
MKHLALGFAASLLLILVPLSGIARATITGDDTCGPDGSTLMVTDGPNGPVAMSVANGWMCPRVNLQILSSLDITDPTLQLRAATLLVQSATPDDPGQRIQMVNAFPNSTVEILTTGDIALLGASVKARKTMKFTCSAPGCAFSAAQSDIIVATDPANPGAGGVLSFGIVGPIDIRTTNLHGGDAIEMTSKTSSITLRCGGSAQPCKDPNVSPIPAVIADQCRDPLNPGQIAFPCTPTFQNAAELRSVCIGADVVLCNGGHKEKRFSAFTDIDIEGSAIASDEHMTFTCKTGVFKGRGAILEAESLRIDCAGAIDISGAQIVTPLYTTVLGGTNCPAGALCLDAAGATISAKPMTLTARNGQSIVDVCAGTSIVPGSGFPRLNNKAAPPYGPTVLATDAQCAPRPAAVFQN